MKSVHNNIISITLFCSLQNSFRSIFPTTGSGSHIKPRPSSSRTCLVTRSQSVPVTTGSYSPQGTRGLRSVCTDLRYLRGLKNPFKEAKGATQPLLHLIIGAELWNAPS